MTSEAKAYLVGLLLGFVGTVVGLMATDNLPEKQGLERCTSCHNVEKQVLHP